LQVHAEHAETGEIRHDLHGKRRPLVMIGDDRKETVVDEAAHGRPDESLLLRQEIIDAIEIDRLRQRELILRSPHGPYLSLEERAWKTRSPCGTSTFATSARYSRSSASWHWRSWASSSPTPCWPPPVRRPTPPTAATRN